MNQGIVLLTEWLEWWKTTDAVFVKTPNALHMRTTLYLDEKQEEQKGLMG